MYGCDDNLVVSVMFLCNWKDIVEIWRVELCLFTAGVIDLTMQLNAAQRVGKLGFCKKCRLYKGLVRLRLIIQYYVVAARCRLSSPKAIEESVTFHLIILMKADH